jgi:hypothetical protein
MPTLRDTLQQADKGQQPDQTAPQEPSSFRRTGTLPDSPLVILNTRSFDDTAVETLDGGRKIDFNHSAKTEHFPYALRFQREGMCYEVQFRNPWTGKDDVAFRITQTAPWAELPMTSGDNMGRSEASFALDTIAREMDAAQTEEFGWVIDALREEMPQDDAAYNAGVAIQRGGKPDLGHSR